MTESRVLDRFKNLSSVSQRKAISDRPLRARLYASKQCPDPGLYAVCLADSVRNVLEFRHDKNAVCSKTWAMPVRTIVLAALSILMTPAQGCLIVVDIIPTQGLIDRLANANQRNKAENVLETGAIINPEDAEDERELEGSKKGDECTGKDSESKGESYREGKDRDLTRFKLDVKGSDEGESEADLDRKKDSGKNKDGWETSNSTTVTVAVDSEGFLPLYVDD